MYDRQEASQLRQEFWTAFGRYMLPIPSAEGGKISWVNYKTSEKWVQFRMDAGNGSAFIAIFFTHPDAGMRQLYFAQMVALKPLLESCVSEAWNWEPAYTDNQGHTYSRVSCTLSGISVLRKTDWPQLVSFFKPRIIALDGFWSQARYYFDALR